MMNPLAHLRVYGGGVDEQVEHHGGTGGSSVCPRGSVYRVDELRVLLTPPRGSMLLLGGAMSSFMLRGDLEIECLLEELDDGSDDHVFLVKTLVAFFHIVVGLTHNECTESCLLVGKTHKGSIWRMEFIIMMMIITIF
jgi:hypothetical protein